MSFTPTSPVRGRCVRHVGNASCLCPSFTAFTLYRDESQPYTLDQPESRCVCGHGIHAHADYVSLIVHHCPANYCVAYTQKTPKTQECACGALLADHVPVFNTYRSPIANVPEPFVGDAYGTGASSYTTNASAPSNDANPMLYASPPSSLNNQTQLGRTAQAGAVAHDLEGYAPNGTFDYPLNVIYDATPESGAWA
ncbi:hypothetical protein ARMGADRAFT_1162829 [Armillaria gallica]|uniref:Uncharacterized protein n=1 Tax=Armillaria gallica TaxID=47427 RepID=A0A2H3DZQ1_ARMGA|nr:hypothetical protein ARMGADRAFT_1162829 [Armillaria gallica]